MNDILQKAKKKKRILRNNDAKSMTMNALKNPIP